MLCDLLFTCIYAKTEANVSFIQASSLIYDRVGNQEDREIEEQSVMKLNSLACF